MFPLLGIGFLPAPVGLFFYAFLPILTNTIADVDGARNAGWSACRYRGDGFGVLPETFE